MKTTNAFWKSDFSATAIRQKGIVAVVVTVGMVALLAITGLALDSGHLLMNKTRLQNAVDAAALAAARTIQLTDGDMVQATTTAGTTFNNNLSNELTGEAPAVTVTFSETLNPGSFLGTVANPLFVKVQSSVVSLDSFLVQVVGVNSKNVNAVAVAGYAKGADACNLIPIMVCEKDPPDGADPSDYFHGYKTFDRANYVGDDYDAEQDLITLKVGSGDGPDAEIGDGNFHLIDLDGLQGANDIRYAFAGNPSCAGLGDAEEVDLSPGNKVGALVQGVNTRFGFYAGPLNGDEATYPPDDANNRSYTDSPLVCGKGSAECGDPAAYFDHYQSAGYNPEGSGFERRIVGVPIARCDGTANGNDTVELVPTGIGCFQLTEPAVQTGGTDDGGGSGSLKGVFMNECPLPASGVTNAMGVDIIRLYKNPDGASS